MASPPTRIAPAAHTPLAAEARPWREDGDGPCYAAGAAAVSAAVAVCNSVTAELIEVTAVSIAPLGGTAVVAAVMAATAVVTSAVRAATAVFRSSIAAI